MQAHTANINWLIVIGHRDWLQFHETALCQLVVGISKEYKSYSLSLGITLKLLAAPNRKAKSNLWEIILNIFKIFRHSLKQLG
jgi:hypothetical protein